MKGNFCTVEMMIFLPASMKRRRSPERLAWPSCCPDLGELPDGVVNLLVQNAAVGDHDDRIEDRGVVLCQPDQLAGQPGDGVALAAARRVLDQVASARPARPSVGQQATHHVELVVARPNLGLLFLARLLVL